jgi:hypothetical protein
MKNSISYIIFLFILSFLTSCERVIELELRDDTGRLVIEANIHDQPGVQTIQLSTNVRFSDQNTYPPVTGAQVSVEDDAGNNYIFREGPAGVYTSDSVAGIYGKTYSLTVVTGDSTFRASSKMPSLVKLDSVTTRKDEFGENEDAQIISVHYQDPPGIANQYRFVLYLNGVLVKRDFVNDDQFSDGRSVELDLLLGDDDDDLEVLPGDRVEVEMQCIDKEVYTYWYSLASQQGSDGPGGSVTPADPPTNITPTSLGYFSAHTTERKSIIVK